MKTLILLGSLRAASFSRKLALAAQAAAPDSMTFEIIDGRDVPLYNQDLDGEEKPAAVQVLLDQVTAADGLLFVTPEFNYGIPASLKNMIDWASRPAFKSPLKGKPALVMSQSVAPAGGARVWAQLTSVLGGTLTPTYLAPSFAVGASHEKFDESGVLTDDLTRMRLERTLADFERWAQSLGS